MKALKYLFLILSLFFSVKALAGPQAHWISENEIHLYFTGARIRGPVHFQLVTDQARIKQDLCVGPWEQNIVKLCFPKPLRDLQAWIKRPLWIKVLDSNDRELYKTPVRLTGLLDQNFANPNHPLGLRWKSSKPSLSVWAPTAQKVELLLFESAGKQNPQVFPLQENESGFWSITGESSWKYKYYLYRVTVFSPLTGALEVNEVTDPYSVSLSANSELSQIINVDDPQLMPIGWPGLKKPKLINLTDSVIYEVHIRDFTSQSANLSSEDIGKYTSLIDPNSKPYQHFKQLSDAGLTHIHFLPLMDFAGVPEIPVIANLLFPANTTPDSPLPQEKIGTHRNRDPYNWGYNPVHWMTPEGSYSKNPQGPQRILEMRQLVKGLNEMGLRFVVDVVFNHSFASGLEDFSVFDRIVPGYYYRYNDRGELMKSSCCPDIATENIMVEKIIVDSLVFLATTYKIDGFRFDLMNLHTKEQADRIRLVLSNLNMANSGVDGSKLLLYGEAWPFGSLEEKQPGSAFLQLRSYGRRIGVFNDRMRDAVRGGTTSSSEKSDQGFATGLYWDFNHEPANRNTPINIADQREKVLYLADVIKVGMAGNLRDFDFRDRWNQQIRGGQINFRGAPVGYAEEPVETISYVSAHDGYSLWDAVQAKLPFTTHQKITNLTSIEERVRVHKIMLATAMLSQGITFIEGGSELLRSKSGDVDSYDSGDWFNRIDWSLQTNNWGVGLPPLWRNHGDWSFWQPRLAHPQLSVQSSHIESTRDYFLALLRLRKETPLLRLPSAHLIRQSISYPVNEISGVDIPGLIVQLIEDSGNVDPKRSALSVFINASPYPQTFANQALREHRWNLPEAFNADSDSRLKEAKWSSSDGRISIPPRSVLVLEADQ